MTGGEVRASSTISNTQKSCKKSTKNHLHALPSDLPIVDIFATFTFPESFELQISCFFIPKCFSMHFLTAICYVATVQISNSENLTLIQYYYLLYSPQAVSVIFWQSPPPSPTSSSFIPEPIPKSHSVFSHHVVFFF